MITTCKDCGTDKPRLVSVQRRQNNRFVYVNEIGKRWNGKQCPECKGDTKKPLCFECAPAHTSKRACRLCKDTLPDTRYFACERCVPDLGEDTLYYGVA